MWQKIFETEYVVLSLTFYNNIIYYVYVFTLCKYKLDMAQLTLNVGQVGPLDQFYLYLWPCATVALWEAEMERE